MGSWKVYLGDWGTYHAAVGIEVGSGGILKGLLGISLLLQQGDGPQGVGEMGEQELHPCLSFLSMSISHLDILLPNCRSSLGLQPYISGSALPPSIYICLCLQDFCLLDFWGLCLLSLLVGGGSQTFLASPFKIFYRIQESSCSPSSRIIQNQMIISFSHLAVMWLRN